MYQPEPRTIIKSVFFIFFLPAFLIEIFHTTDAQLNLAVGMFVLGFIMMYLSFFRQDIIRRISRWI